MRFQCSHCSRVLKVSEGLAGRKAKCPACGRVMVIPASGEAAASPPDTSVPAAEPPAAGESDTASDAGDLPEQAPGDEGEPLPAAAEAPPPAVAQAGDETGPPAAADQVRAAAGLRGRLSRLGRVRPPRRVLTVVAIAAAALIVVVFVWWLASGPDAREKAAMDVAEQALRTAHGESCRRVVGKPFSVEAEEVTFGLPPGDASAALVGDATRAVLVVCSVSGPNGSASAHVYMMPRGADEDAPNYVVFRASVTKGE